MKVESIAANGGGNFSRVELTLEVPGDAMTAIWTVLSLVQTHNDEEAAAAMDAEDAERASRDTVEKVELPRPAEKTSVEEFVKAALGKVVTKETAPEATPSPRRRRAAATGQSEAHPTVKPESTPPQMEASASSASPSAPRRRRGVQPEADATSNSAPAPTETTAASPTDISDADLLKAASQAAMKITPKGVMEFLATFGAKQVNDLKGEQRRQFIDGLKTRTA